MNERSVNFRLSFFSSKKKTLSTYFSEHEYLNKIQ